MSCCASSHSCREMPARVGAPASGPAASASLQLALMLCCYCCRIADVHTFSGRPGCQADAYCYTRRCRSREEQLLWTSGISFTKHEAFSGYFIASGERTCTFCRIGDACARRSALRRYSCSHISSWTRHKDYDYIALLLRTPGLRDQAVHTGSSRRLQVQPCVQHATEAATPR